MNTAYLRVGSEKYGEFQGKSPNTTKGDCTMQLGSRALAERSVLSLPQAVYHAVHDTRGGVGAVAGAFGFNESTFNKKVSLTQPGHKLTLDDFEAVLGITRDPRLMDSVCDAFGHAAWVDLGGLVQSGDAALIAQLGELSRRVGQMATDLADTMADGRVDSRELGVLRKDAAQLHQTVASIIARAEAMAGVGNDQA